MSGPGGSLERLIEVIEELTAELRLARFSPGAIGAVQTLDAPPFDRVWMSITEVVGYSGVNSSTVGDALRDGSLRGWQVVRGGKWRVHRDDVDAWLRGLPPVSEAPRVTRRRYPRS